MTTLDGMTTRTISPRTLAGPAQLSPAQLSPAMARAVLITAIATAVAASLLAFDTATVSKATLAAGDDLTRLLRFMAVVKVGLALAAVAALLWRLADGIGSLRLAAYTLACAAMCAGPGLIWTMAHVGLGALLLHGGLLATGAMLWTDPVVPRRLAIRMAARRRTSR